MRDSVGIAYLRKKLRLQLSGSSELLGGVPVCEFCYLGCLEWFEFPAASDCRLRQKSREESILRRLWLILSRAATRLRIQSETDPSVW